MVYRVYVEKRPGLEVEAAGLKNDLVSLLGIAGLEKLRLLNRYDAENISPELFDLAVKTVFSEPQVDTVCQTPELDLYQNPWDSVACLPRGCPALSVGSTAQTVSSFSPGFRRFVRSNSDMPREFFAKPISCPFKKTMKKFSTPSNRRTVRRARQMSGTAKVRR